MEAEILFKKRFRIREGQSPEDLARIFLETMGFEYVSGVVLYDPTYGNDISCMCGHPYYRHFNTHENMAPVGCKYCGGECSGFRRKTR